ncbi:N-acetylmuramoyl-L-alanine amidase [Streptomyces sp. NBC_00264]|uniref:peptidoglycan recognition protein family protein n=1 Tax=unclassified Streptomyces TaxID=2593676 RepID=UPI00225A2CCC|nr:MULTISPECIES: N-acetylmuramoyl-L-alanine amidase [unclassified Streptomyces]MCX5158678.1 N-acetylmuramoyl-L-alanine amidase [Streptomyces sp. NBC_00305]MCX5217201.1 N-acetylmuramoyl-L-alanine amidase [Streptomyces sp. NBC_00264]
MAAPLAAERLLQALWAEGVHVVEVGNWRTHNRNSKGPWGPLNGSIVHHTVTRGTASTVRIVRDGYSDLPGPLCHGMIAKDGRAHLVGWGRTNHAGGGDPKVLGQVVAESYSSSPAPPTRGNANGVDGNAHFYGWECENLGDGKDPWPAAQYDAIVRVQAALCRAHGWSAKSVIGHREWSRDKVDPRGIDMPRLRADVAERLKHPANWNPGTGPNEEDPMAGITKRDIFDAVWKTDAIGGPADAADHSANPTWQPQSILKDMQARIRSMDKRMTAQTAAITALAGQVGTGADTQTVVSAVEAAIQRAVTDAHINTREI